jgi:toxin ParE1/3/4
MKEYKIVWTANAIKQLDKIYAFLAQNSLKAAEKHVLALLEKVDQLKSFPQMGQEEARLKHLKKGHRYLKEGNYKIIYRIKGQVIHIATVFDTRQDPDKLKP